MLTYADVYVLGLSFGISSYNGDLRVAVMDGNDVVETELLMTLVSQAFRELHENMMKQPVECEQDSLIPNIWIV